MDLSKELFKINENEDGLSIVLEKLQKEQELIEKKKHIFEIIQIVQKIKEMVPVLLKENITYLVVNQRTYERYNPLKKGYTIELSPKGLLPTESVSVRDEKQNFLPWFNSLLEVTKDFDLKSKYTEELTDTEKHKTITVDLKLENSKHNNGEVRKEKTKKI